MAIENTMSSQPMADGLTASRSYYHWAPEGKQIQVWVDLDVVDRLSAEVMRGFGAVPKRGAEVGGILLGEVNPGKPLVVRIHDFAMVACDYRRGPSYQLTENDTRLFSETVNRVTEGTNPELRPVGYFRSHTRDGMSLADDDLQLFSNYFPDPTSIMLLVRPFATKVSQAGFFFEENGQIRSDATYLTFPFRRRELGGSAVSGGGSAPDAVAEPFSGRGPIPIRETLPKSTSAAEDTLAAGSANLTENRRLFGNRDDAPTGFTPSFEAAAQREPMGMTAPPPVSAPDFGMEASQRVKKSWVWLPLSSIFLLLGVLVGFLIAVTMKRPVTAVPLTAYGLSLAVQQEADAIHVTWDRAAVPVMIATRGVLHIQDGDFYKAVELKPADLQTGSVIIRNVRNSVTLRLEVFLMDRNSLTEVRVVKSVGAP